jgi:hypothetical protein
MGTPVKLERSPCLKILHLVHSLTRTNLGAAVDQAIAACGGDAREAVKALLVANEFLEAQISQRLHAGCETRKIQNLQRLTHGRRREAVRPSEGALPQATQAPPEPHALSAVLVIARRASDLHWPSKQDCTRERGSDSADFRSIGSRTMAEVTYFVALPFVITSASRYKERPAPLR